MSFATTYRPPTLDEVYGNSVVKKLIREIIDTGKYSPILLEGETGSGKTTLAYIIANCFGADPKNIFDINCIDSGIADIRGILDSIDNPSIFGNKKVLILDEIHGISSQAKSILLKPMESLSKDVLVIACTTDPQKLPVPLLDRFTYKFKVMPLSDAEAKKLVYAVGEKEGIQFPKWKLALLLEKSQGIPRRLLNGLERTKDIDSEDEVKFLLEFSGEIKTEILTFFKLLLSYKALKTNSYPFWMKVSEQLKLLMKTSSYEEIRVGIASLLMGRATSEYAKVNETCQLSQLYQVVRLPLVFPEKADLINRVYQLVEIIIQ